jgi:hypothetical protein
MEYKHRTPPHCDTDLGNFLKNESFQTHPSLLRWDELPAEEKEKDRNAVRALPRILKTVNLKIIRLAKKSG